MNRAAWLQDRRMQKFRDVFGRWEAGDLSMMEAGELLGMSERQFRRYRDRYEEDGVEGLVDRRLGKPSSKRVPATERERMLALYREVYRGWNVQHFHEHLRRDHGFRWGYTWVKTQLHTAGLVERAKRRGAHRRKRERKPFKGMMLHQDGSRAGWLAGEPPFDLIVTMDDATSTIYSAFLVEEEGTASSFRALLETYYGARFAIEPLHRSWQPLLLHAARGWTGRQAASDAGWASSQATRDRAYSSLFAGGARAQRAHVRHLARPADQGARASRDRRHYRGQPIHPRDLSAAAQFPLRRACSAGRQCVRGRRSCASGGFLRLEEERIVARDNTVVYGRRRLQLPATPSRAHYVKATVRRGEYPDGSLAVFHGPRRLARSTPRARSWKHPICGRPRDPLRPATHPLWICGQAKVPAHKLHNANTTTNRSGQVMCYQNRTT